jgi:hypothetical protein
MNSKELLETYPKTGEIVGQWFLKRLVDSMDDVTIPQDFKDYLLKEGISNDKVARLIENQPRCLFDVMDENGIFIDILSFNSLGGNKRTWHYEINDVGMMTCYSSRKETEGYAVEEAFKLLEEQLNNKENE